MIERVHEHLSSELRQSARTDTVFVLTAILLNLVLLAVNSIVAGEAGESSEQASTIVMFAFITLQAFVSVAAVFGLLRGKKVRLLILDGLLRMYRDQKVDTYYSERLLTDYAVRYHVFVAVVAFLGVISVVVPLVLRFL
jgi:hypothetical protein